MRCLCLLFLAVLFVAACTKQATVPPPKTLDEFLERELVRLRSDTALLASADPDERAFGESLVGVSDVKGLKEAFKSACKRAQQRQWRRLTEAYPELGDFRALKAAGIKGSNGWPAVELAASLAKKYEDDDVVGRLRANPPKPVSHEAGLSFLKATADLPKQLEVALKADCVVWIPPAWKKPIELQDSSSDVNCIVRVELARIRLQGSTGALSELELLTGLMRRADVEGSMLAALFADVALQILADDILLPTLEAKTIEPAQARTCLNNARQMPRSLSRAMFLESAAALPLILSGETPAFVSLTGHFEDVGPTSLEQWLGRERAEVATLVDWRLWLYGWLRQTGYELSDADNFSRMLREKKCPIWSIRGVIHSRLTCEAHLCGVELRALEIEKGSLTDNKAEVEAIVSRVRGLNIIWHAASVELSPDPTIGLSGGEYRDTYVFKFQR